MSLEAAVARVLQAVRSAAARAGRDPKSITLVAVSKTKSVREMHQYADAAIREGVPVVFGENYIQEIQEKRSQLPPGSELHMIGPLQSNKVRDAVALCDVIESVHTMKTLNLVVKEAARINKLQRILLQVNIGRDEKKSGFLPEALSEALEFCRANTKDLQLEGLMTILPYSDEPEQGRPYYQAMATLRALLYSQGKGQCFYNHEIALSMGMSDDFNLAIEEGADLVRVGTAIFGERSHIQSRG